MMGNDFSHQRPLFVFLKDFEAPKEFGVIYHITEKKRLGFTIKTGHF
jgi:hypothetical protein